MVIVTKSLQPKSVMVFTVLNLEKYILFFYNQSMLLIYCISLHIHRPLTDKGGRYIKLYIISVIAVMCVFFSLRSNQCFRIRTYYHDYYNEFTTH